ncbi:MAG: Lrp/AsnC family transcriptional regulator [Ignavibacterium album]|jgi:Lrp/AsnC family leucine-responsive transcriptional regulator|uniref:Lrp/AsnC family transcriptional regulator n=1 Tax=Ignavibacterium album TaxID=591197 RepID=UPI0026EBE13E|nr:Lrp/AsnC family transcriptional regulator [Ignavibacterium album]MCX8104565.1 Lrp/AsnC family transcriptional regulator [Ignavibacterium album]
MKIDLIDKQILAILQQDARITNVQLAKKIGISPPAMLERVKRLEKNGIIKRYVAILDPSKVSKGVFALVSVSLNAHQLASIDQFTKQIKKLDEVLECYHVAGEEDFILKIAVSSIQDYENFILSKLTKINGVSKVNTKFVLSTVKYNTKIKIE